MRGVDRSVLPLLRSARSELVTSVAATVVAGILVVVQAFVVTGLVVTLVDDHRVGGWGAAVVGVFAARALFTWVSDVAAARAAERLGVSMRHDVLAATVGSAGRSGVTLSPGAAATLCTRGVSALEPYLTRFVPAVVVATTLPALTVIAMASQDVLSAVIVILTLPLIPVFAALVGWSTQTRARRQWRELAALSGHFLDVVRGLPTLVAYRRAEAQVSTIRRITDRYRQATLDTLRLAFASSAVLELMATISVALVAVAVGLRLASGDLDLSTALVVLLLAPEAYWPLRRVGAEFHAAAEGSATLSEVASVESAARQSDGLVQPDLVLPLVLEDVSVTYPGREIPALESASCLVERGVLVAVTGPSGAGKSTLLNALRGGRGYEGQIRAAGLELRDLDLDWWRRQVAWMPQRPWFVPGTVAANVRVGRPEATDADVWEALRRVGLDAVVATRPGGIGGSVGEDGGALSAGERARLALARAVVSRRPIVLLDEPTAHLDAESEQIVLDTVRWLARDAAVVVVAHRDAVADAADRVLEIRPPEDRPSADVTPGTADDTPGSPPAASVSAPARATRKTVEPALEAGSRNGRRLLSGILLGVLASLAGVALTATSGWLIVRASEQPPVLALLVAIIGVRTFGIARPAFRYAERLTSHDAALRTLADRRARVYADLVPLTPGALGRRRGDLLASVVDDVDAEVDLRLRVWSPLATGLAVGLVAAVLAALVSPWAGAAIGALTAVAALSSPLCRRAAARAERSYVADRGALSDEVTIAVEGAEHLVAWQAEATAAATVDEVGRRVSRAARRSAVAGSTCRAAVLVLVGLGVLAVAVATAADLRAATVSAPVAALLVLIPLGLAEALVALPDSGLVRARVDQAMARLDMLAGLEPLVRDSSHPVGLPADPPGELQLDAVSAGWGSADVLVDVSVDLRPGRRLAVVGPSGCGKSTLAALLIRFLDPRTGQVRLAGVDERLLTLSEVRGMVGLVDDDPHVFASTVVENIRLARPGAGDEEVEAALRSARLGGWLDELPRGLDTFLGEQGQQISGGERARLALARAVLADQAVVVLDEPAAHLDHATATLVLGDLVETSTGRTVVLISHRAEGLDAADQVLDLGVGAAGTTLDTTSLAG